MTSKDSSPSTTFKHCPAKLIWEIENFSTTDFLQSPKFAFPENTKVTFMLECSPNVDREDNAGKFVVFNLILINPSNQHERIRIHPLFLFEEDFCVRYKITILNTNGQMCYSQESQNKFTNRYDIFPSVIGVYQIKRDYLLKPSNGLLINDKLTVYCEIDDNCLKRAFKYPDNPIFDDFRSLLKSGKFSDAVLLIGGKSLLVHKNILAARSEVFAAMFEHDLEEKKTNRVEITDVSIEVFELMLYYIYTGQISQLSECALELFIAADKYQLNILRNACEKHLMKNLTLESTANILVIADMHQASELKDACTAFITENVKQIKLTQGWNCLLNKADLMAELFLKMVDKQAILIEKMKSLEYDIKVLKKLAPPKIANKSNPKYCVSKATEEFLEHHRERKMATKLFEDNIETLLENGKFSDAFLVVGNERVSIELAVHRNILSARSEVFANLFKTQTRVQVDNISVEACMELLRYIYTGRAVLSENEFAPHLLEASHKFHLNYLKSKCERFLSASIDLDTVVNKFLLAGITEANYLKQKCFDFICENVKQVIQTEGWKTLKQTRSEFAVQLFEHIAEKKW